MESHGEVWILQQVSRQDQDHGFVRLYKALLDQLFQSSQRNRGGGFAANAFGADLRLGLCDLDFTHLFAGCARRFQNLNRLLPRGGIADADRGGTGLRLYADQAFAASLAQGADQRIGAFGLNNRQLRQARNQAQVVQFDQRLADRGTISQVPARDDDVVGRLPIELFEQLEGQRLLPFEAKGINRIQLVDRRAQNQFLQQAQAAVEVGA